ncbi:hypothetical protein [Phaeodactylibacter luteus]|uniref:Uncharacterized protein n=1 Tax=Phaeodactylibacter luteus TaxID=1564516 RepID=A0A5C6RW47_9BACT|nr:hypothetical protein [Phaeodactylibacter luteus]TXB66541.1 hypothetical protein FRY97_04965 [Phaeodactylibacter luteus]
MLHLLQLEWKKFNSHTAFRLFILFYLLLLPSTLLVGLRFDELPPPLYSNDVFFMFPTVWEYLGYIGNWLCFFFFGFLSIIIVTNEYSYKTLRQNIITGMSRKSFFLGKLYFILAISLAATLYYALCGFLIGYLNTEAIYWHKVMQNADYIPRYFLMCMGYMSFGLFLGFMIRRTGLALFVYLTYVMFLELILRWGVHMQIIAHRSMHFYPMNAVEDLVSVPFLEMADEFISKYGFSIYLQPGEAAITVLVYSSLFLYLAYRRVAYSDL